MKVYKMCIVTTFLDNENGLAAWFEIYDAIPPQVDIKKLYLMGAKVAIKQPYINISNDDGFTIHMDNLDNIVNIMTEKGKPTESMLHLDLEDLREERNICFREKSWFVTAKRYTKHIGTTLLQIRTPPFPMLMIISLMAFFVLTIT